ENVTAYLAKGSLLAVDGSVRTRVFEVNSEKRKVTEIVANSISFLDGKKKGAGKGSEATSGNVGNASKETDLLPEDLVFN
ncbi:MAG: single-stranded DNA-binding protein, partial [Anaerolineae bacterium]